MVKKLLTFLTLLTLFFGVGWAADGFVTLQYSGSETTNMTGNNDATLLGLDENSWSVVGDKGSSQYYPGLNKNKYIALYYAAQGSNTLTVSSLNGATIEDIKISYTGNSYKNSSVFVNGTKITEKSSGDYWKEYAINNSSFVVGNANTSNTQVRITSIIIYYSSGGAQPTTYNVNLNQSTGGTISASSTTAAAGTTVTLTATPDAGYEFTSWEVLDGDANEVTVTNNQFTMPASDVEVEATFTEQSTTGGDTYKLVTKASDLVSGAKYLITNANGTVLMGAITSGNTPYAGQVTTGFTTNSNDNTITLGTSCAATPLTLGGSTGAWTLDNGSGYIAYTSNTTQTTGSNGLWLVNDVTKYGATWKITIPENSPYSSQTLIENASNTLRSIRYNSGSSRFAGYGTGQAAIALYKKVETGAYTVICDNDNIEHGSISASPATADEDATITITATPDAGYELSTVTITPETGSAFQATVSGNTATFEMPAGNVTVSATFALAWNAITDECEPSTGGEVWVNPSGDAGIVVTGGTSTAQMGTSVTFKVVPNNGFNISTVTATDASGSPVSLTVGETNSSHNGWGTYYTFIMPSSAVNITATFTEGNLYIIGTANDNTWNGNIGVQMTYDTQNKVFTKDVFFSADDYGYFSFADALSGQDGSWANMGRRYGAPENNYDLQNNNWTATWDSDKQDNSFKVPAGIYTVTVNKATGNVTLTPKTVTVTLDKAAGQLESGTTVNVVSNLTSLLQDCKSGITGTLAYSTNDGTSYTNGSSFPVTEDMTAKGKAYYGYIEAESDSYAYTVVTHYAVTATANPAKGGTVSVSPTSALAGETVTVTANPKSGYELTSITVNGDEIDITNTPYTFEMPAQAANVVATFTAKTLNLTINNDNSKGTVYGVPATSTVSSEISFTVTPKEGYTVNTVTYSFTPDGGAENTTTLTAPYKFNMPGYDVTINITYTEQSSGGGDETDLYHESFGNNSSSVRDWDDSYSVKTGVEAVYRGITGYTVENVGQSKNTVGYIESGLAQRSQNSDASIIIGPLNVANYTDLILSYYWKAASVGATYYTKLYYATSATGTYTEVEGTGAGATTFVERSYNLPEAAQVSTLYLKIIYRTSNSQAVIDEVNLSGVPNAVSDPVFTPAQGLYGIDVDVTISCPTSGATIYYTDDNSDPKTSTTRKEYTGEIVVSQTTTFKAYAEKDGMSSDVVTATYTINKNTEIETVTLDYIEPFTGSDGIGKFTINNESGYSPVWSLDGNYGVKGTAYNPNTTPTNNAAVSRLVSPIIDMTDANIPELTFSHQINSYFTDPSTQCTVWIRETTDGTSGTWNQLPVTVTVPASGSWSNDFARIDLSGYAGKKVQISFLYSNPTEGSGAGTWEIQNFRVTDNSDIVVVNNIAEFMDEEVTQGTIARFRNPVVVLYHYQQYYDDEQGDYSNDYIWVKDNSGYAIIYGHYLDVEYENGDVIPAGFTATKNYYSVGQFYQMFEPEGLQPSTEKALADPEPVTLAKLMENKEGYNGHYVTISKMQIQFSQGQLVAYTTGTSGQRNFSVGDETIAISNNQSGNSGSIIGYNNFDNPWLETLNYPAYENTATVYGDFNITGIFEQYNGKWEFMPIIITPWEPNKVTLHDLCEKGTVNETYTISNRLQCVYIQGNKLWVKDDNGQSIHKTTPASDDNNYEIGESSGNTQLNQSLYDQSNWLEVHLADGSANAQAFYRHIIKGGTITGTFTNKTNPTMVNVVLTSTALENSDEIGGIVEYAPNYYCAANFYNGIEGGNQACTGSENHGNFFFMNPKPQEYVQIDWAQWDGTKMIIPTGEGANEHRFNGEFGVDMSLNSNPNFSPSVDTAYKFEAIVRRIESTGGNSLRANKSNDYIVYPLNLSDNVVTGINNVAGKAVAGVKYYNLAGMESDRPFEGVNIIVTTYTDGSRSSAKVLK